MSLAMLGLFERMVQIAADVLVLPSLLGLLVLGGWCAWEFGHIFAELIFISKRTNLDVQDTVMQLRNLKGSVLPQNLDSVVVASAQRGIMNGLYEQRHLDTDSMRNIGNLLIARDEIRRSQIVRRAQLAAKLGIMLGLMLAVISLAASGNGVNEVSVAGAGVSGAVGTNGNVEFVPPMLKACGFIVVGFGVACSAQIISHIRERRKEKDINDTRMIVEVFIEIIKT